MPTEKPTAITSLLARLSGWRLSFVDWLNRSVNRMGKSSWLPVAVGAAASTLVISIGAIVDVWWFWFLVIPAAIALGGLASILVWEKVR